MLFLLLLVACRYHQVPGSSGQSENGPYWVSNDPTERVSYGECAGEYDLDLSGGYLSIENRVSGDFVQGVYTHEIGGEQHYVSCMFDHECKEGPLPPPPPPGEERWCIDAHHCCDLGVVP